MIYVDASAAVKAVITEPGSAGVRQVLGSGVPLVSSRLLALEMHAAVQRRRANDEQITQILSRIGLVAFDDATIDAAIAGGSGLRALDAVHLATAMQLGDAIDSILCFDRELLQRAADAGIPPHPLVGADPAR